MADPLREARIDDPRIIRLIQKWLKASVLEDGGLTVGEKGTGQGLVISPLLANVYLHYVFDLWAERWRRREAKGDMIMVRYADDIIVGFEHEADDHVTVLWRGRVPPPFLCCRWCASAGWASAGVGQGRVCRPGLRPNLTPLAFARARPVAARSMMRRCSNLAAMPSTQNAAAPWLTIALPCTRLPETRGFQPWGARIA